MSKFKINSITNENGNYGPVISGVSTNNSSGCMIIPSGNTGRRVEYNTVNDNDIVTDGLIFHLDFANTDCFGRSGNVVYDLSGAGHHPTGTIIGTCSYSPSGGGSMQMGKGGHINFGSIDEQGPFLLSGSGNSGAGDKITICSWVGDVDMSTSANVIFSVWSNTAASGWLASANETTETGNRPMPAVIASDGGDGSGAWSRPGWNGPNIPQYDPRALSYWQTVKSINSGIGNTTVAVGENNFNHLVQRITRNGNDGTWDIHTHINNLVNGMETPLFESTGENNSSEPNPWGSSNRSLRIGATDAYASGTSYMDGKIAIVMAYNRKLTDAEIAQNFNAQRYRFGR